MSLNNVYTCIDLKSFYASVECVERGLDPFEYNLVVADSERTDKTICLAVSPALKSFGIPGRIRLFEVKKKIKQINKERLIISKKLNRKSFKLTDIKKDKTVEVDFLIATPRMSLYIKYSSIIYSIYLKYFSKEDIHVYSIDEVFIDITNYITVYKLKDISDVEKLILKILKEIFVKTKITATAGIGDNLYLAKVAMDIVAKHATPNEDGALIAYLNEEKYKKTLWAHTPITDFWRVGKGISQRLLKYNIETMGDLARFSFKNDDILYKEFGINAELLIDHAFGFENATMKDIKEYKPLNNSLSIGQVLSEGYKYQDALTILKEMAESLSLKLASKKLYASHLNLFVSYDSDFSQNDYKGEVVVDYLNRLIPKPISLCKKLPRKTRLTTVIANEFSSMFEKNINQSLLVRRISIGCMTKKEEDSEDFIMQDLFTDFDMLENNIRNEKEDQIKEENLQKTLLLIKEKFGRNSILKGINISDKATMIERNKQIGGHKS